MKILRIKIENIASIVDTSIAFDEPPLSRDPIFLISGKTGSGKSTILNAISLALYGTTPGLEAFGQSQFTDAENLPSNNPGVLVRRGAKNASIILDFIGNDRREYSAIWEARRPKRRTADKKPFDITRSLLDKEKDITIDKVKDVQSAINSLLGLTFEQFSRTTILAQGQLSRFLHSNLAERSSLLEKITGTEIYSRIGSAIFNKMRTKESECDTVQAIINGYNTLSDEEISQSNARIDDLTVQIAQLSKSIETVESQITWLSVKAGLDRELADRSAEQTRLAVLLDSETMRQISRRYDLLVATADARRYFSELQKAQTDADAQRCARSRKITTTLGSIASGLLCLEQSHKRLMTNRDNIVADIREAIPVLCLDDDVPTERVASIDIPVPDLKALYRKQNEASKRAESARLAIEALASLKLCSDDLAEEEKGLKTLTEEIESLKKDIVNADQLLPALEKNFRALERQLNGAKKIREHIDDIRRAFADDHVCPVCGTSDVHIRAESDISAHLAQMQSLTDNAYKEYSNCNAERSASCRRLSAVGKELEAKTRQRDAKKTLVSKAQADAEAKCRVAGASDPELLDEIRKIASTTALQLQQSVIRISDFNKKVNSLKELVASIQSVSDEIDTVRLSLEKSSVALPATEEVTPINHPGLKAAALDFSTAIAGYDSAIASATARAEKAEKSLGEALANLPEISRDVLAQLSTDAASIEETHRKFDQARRQLDDATAATKTIQEQIERHQTQRPEMPENPDAPELLIARKAELTEARNTAITEKSAIATRLAENKKTMQKIVEETARLKELKEEFRLWRLLNDNLGRQDGGYFRQVAQSYVLRNLLAKANTYLRDLCPRYTLTNQDENLSINVVDLLQDGEARNVTSLSGGETFIVSLSLALALSSISKDNIVIDTLFIDEGFGSLDSESLEIVIEALDRLHTIGGRRIGIISHVEELKDRIPTQIILKRIGPNSSTVNIIPH